MTSRSLIVLPFNHRVGKIVLKRATSFVWRWHALGIPAVPLSCLQKSVLQDPSLSGIQFTDKDLDILELGGT